MCILAFHFPSLILFTETERCQCNEVVWKAFTGVLIFFIIILIILILWLHKRGKHKSSLILLKMLADYFRNVEHTIYFFSSHEYNITPTEIS